ncbi:Putative fibronectin type III, peptidase M28 [Septoria linicola]|uniref:Peptide hydrolase n=1 Tax=Septoria linicola TaxID=215465 RepID=A0A9Q9AQJ0_9PEZI|nr:putative fibronectin type III, peptidase M28 [Septoria linicola]USW51263.1 Putative fibronectin type III, peptidase M28 [Septoria linicola]
MVSRLLLLASLPSLITAQRFWARDASNEQTWMGLPGSIYEPSGLWGDAKDASWPPTQSNLGQRLRPQAPNDELQDMLAEVDENRVKHTISKLVSFGTRHTLSSQNSTTRGIGAARDWIYAEMLKYAEHSRGGMDVYFNSYIQPVDGARIPFPTNITNIVAQINGTTDPERVYVVTGHHDSRRLDVLDYEGDAPGADDDASGVAVVLEMARICAKRKPAATMIFAAVAGEEQGLYGSANLAKTLKQSGYRVEGNWNNDIVGTGKSQPFAPINNYTVRLFGPSIYFPNATNASAALQRTTAQIGGWNDSPAQNLGRFIAEVAAGAAKHVGMQVALIYRADRFLRGGDHQSFLTQGFPAVRFSEAVEDFAHQHQDPREQDGIQYGDLLDFVDFDYTSRVAKVNLASMWAAANAPALPKDVTISRVIGFPAANRSTDPAIITNKSGFSWTTGEDPLVESYELVWRESGNVQWSYALDVGNVGNVTVDLNKDNYQFGIRAVGKNGWKSPAVWPVPA